ncbi:MAG: hypothetical protein HY243_03660 [Proteobacteria bacterium]|nr:hypothetical protein [Pseudomonadota bacterium]
MHIAAGLESTAPLQVLIRYRGDPNSGTWNSPSWALQAAFDLGAKVGDWRNYYFLLNSGADINREYGDETIALHAVIRGRFDKSAYYDKVLELLKRGYSHDLTDLASSMNISWICGTTVSLSVEQQKAKDDVILVLKGRGVKFPVPPPVERTSGTVTLETDSSLSVWWHGGHSTCGKAVPIKFQIVKPTDPSYKVILKRVGGLKRYQTKDILRQANDPLR